MEERVRRAKERFNALLEAALRRKGGVLGRIEERAARAAEICRELGVADEGVGLAGHPNEVPGRALEVDDSEVCVSGGGCLRACVHLCVHWHVCVCDV